MLTSLQTRVVGFLGALAPFFYLIAVITGGYLWTGYSQYSETVSMKTMMDENATLKKENTALKAKQEKTCKS